MSLPDCRPRPRPAKMPARHLAVLCIALVLAWPCAAQAGCSLSDVARYRTALLEPVQEATPAYIRRVSEAFIRQCPDRPETGEARLTAARAALDSGDAAAAAGHYAHARMAGTEMSALHHLDHSLALLATGRSAEARRAHRLARDAWQDALARQGIRDIRSIRSAGGTIISVRFPGPDPAGGVRALWLGLPDGPGLPASVQLRSDPFRAALQTLRTQRPAGVLSQHRCQGTSLLLETGEGTDAADMEMIAISALRAYLRRPDRPVSTGNALTQACLTPERILYIP